MSAKIHDFKKRGIGHDYVFRPRNDGLEADITGWCEGIRQGDVLVLYADGHRAAYVVDSISYYQDPRDMFTGKLHYERGLLVDGETGLELSRAPEVRAEP